MKAITLWQPWASLLACGAKEYETRSWQTSYRGPIAIHAAARKYHTGDMPAVAVYAAIQALRPITSKLAKTTMYLPLELLPRGCIIATAELVGCHEMRSYIERTAEIIIQTQNGERLIRAEENEYLFGDWTPGRYAWEFANMAMLPEPVPVKGKQGLWNWREADDGQEQV